MDNIFKDFLGNNISIGDEVVFIQLKYRNLLKGRVKKITDKTVLIEHERTNTCSTETRQFHDQIIVIKDKKCNCDKCTGLKDIGEYYED